MTNENGGKVAATQKQQNMADSLKGELAALFGEPVLTRAQNCAVGDLDFSPGEVAQACRELRRLSSKPEAQIMMVRSLPADLQAALCIWMLDDTTPAKVLMAKGGRLH